MSYIPGQKYDSIYGVLQFTQFPLCYDFPQSRFIRFSIKRNLIHYPGLKCH